MKLKISSAVMVLLAVSVQSGFSQCFVATLPQIGEREFCISQTGPTGDLITPDAPSVTPFRPPSIFSAPLPSGSGARAMGLAGAFTAVADDATAASWNPAGLVRLERAEASIVFRYAREKDQHHVTDPSLKVGENEYDNVNLNYLSIVYPFNRKILDRNVVASLNYQEAYDFAQEFTANFSDRSSGRKSPSVSDRFSAVTTETVTDGLSPPGTVLDVTIHSVTEVTTAFDQLLAGAVDADVDFKQEGIIDAVTPAVAFEITPKLYFGASLNFYQDGSFFGNDIRSRTRATYTGASDSQAVGNTVRTTTGTLEFEGVQRIPAGDGFPEIEIGLEGSQDIDPIVESSTSSRSDAVVLDGIYEEVNEFNDLSGINGTFGILWNVSRHLTLGGTVDLPWTAEADQKRTVRQEVTTLNEARTRILDQNATETMEQKDVEFDFPLYWSLGALWRWSTHFYTSLDLSQTQWSEFSFKAAGEERINPLDGSPHREKPLDDTWSVRLGTEYLFVGTRTEVPVRLGFAWEQRPALEDPDDYYMFSAGSGISFGKDPGKTILDFAYVLTLANDVSGVIPEQADLTSDVTEHQLILSFIQHF